MSAINKLLCPLFCPTCKRTEAFLCEMKVGDRRQLPLVVGSQYPWLPRKSVKNGGRPPGGNITARCFAYCTKCSTERFVDVTITDDKIVGAVFSASQESPAELLPSKA
jgi:hypothetical protein